MTTHPSARIRARYVEGTLSGDELLALDDHLSACAECRAALSPPLSRAEASLRDALAGEHPEYEEIEGYVEETLPAAAMEEMKAHLALCAMCAEEVRDLRPAVERSRPPQWTWWAVAAAVLLAILGAIALFRPRSEREVLVPRVVKVAPVPEPAERPAAVDPLAQLSPSLRRTLDQLRAGVVPGAAISEELRGDRERRRGKREGDSELGVVAPLGVVEDTRPMFRWTSNRDASWVVEVFDASYRRAARSGTLTATRWRPEAPLRRGAVYSWQVFETSSGGESTAPAPPEPPARFRILDERSAAELRDARTTRSHLAAALVYAREGILDRAASEMSLAQTQHPQSKEIEAALRTLRRP